MGTSELKQIFSKKQQKADGHWNIICCQKHIKTRHTLIYRSSISLSPTK